VFFRLAGQPVADASAPVRFADDLGLGQPPRSRLCIPGPALNGAKVPPKIWYIVQRSVTGLRGMDVDGPLGARLPLSFCTRFPNQVRSSRAGPMPPPPNYRPFAALATHAIITFVLLRSSVRLCTRVNVRTRSLHFYPEALLVQTPNPQAPSRNTKPSATKPSSSAAKRPRIPIQPPHRFTDEHEPS
jgi:hypothetical protein